MSEIRLYREFIKFTAQSSEDVIKTYIDPVNITAQTQHVSSASTIIESDIAITRESLGFYYVDLDPDLYSENLIYDLNWYVEFVSGAPIKKIRTRFRVSPNVIGGNFDVEVLNIPIEVDVSNGS